MSKIKITANTAQKLTDLSPMPYGCHKGDRMIDIPESYLLFLYTNGHAYGPVKEYIEDNMDAIRSKQRK